MKYNLKIIHIKCNMIIYIEKEIVKTCSSNSIINELKNMKKWRFIIYSYIYTKLCILFIVLVIVIKYINFECIIFTSEKILIRFHGWVFPFLYK